jgi:dinuclear metal center YbgI/SA1388 family protein
MLNINQIISYLEALSPLSIQESYDNSGLIVGREGDFIESALVTIDVTEEVIEEAIQKKAGIIIAHHPLIFSGLKKITGKNYIERGLLKAIRNNIAIYAAHTNFDSISNGVNAKICEKLNLVHCKILDPLPGKLKKLVTFVPADFAEMVREAVFMAGAGHIGEYDSCSFNTQGKGSFRASEHANPYVGEKGVIHFEPEIRFETIFPVWVQQKVISALIEVHPYEEVAYDIYPLDNMLENTGMGMIGDLAQPMPEPEFIALVKNVFGCMIIKHTAFRGKSIQKVAVCGGSGSFLLNKAISAKADIFITSDFKYHQFFDAEKQTVIADVGHYESEQFTKELFYELLTKKFPTFAVHLSEVKTNPVFYF